MRFETGADGVLDAYKHMQNDRGTIGVLVELGGVDPATPTGRRPRRRRARDRAARVVRGARLPHARGSAAEAVLERERAVIEEKSRNEGVPGQAAGREGRLNAFYKDVVLLEQPSVKDPKVTIAKLVEGLGPNAMIRRFARVKVGED